MLIYPRLLRVPPGSSKKIVVLNVRGDGSKDANSNRKYISLYFVIKSDLNVVIVLL